MIVSFGDNATADLYHGRNTNRVRRFPPIIQRLAIRKFDILNAAYRLEDLREPPGNRLEALKGDLAGYHSIRVNDQWRIIFRWEDNNASEVSLTDYHWAKEVSKMLPENRVTTHPGEILKEEFLDPMGITQMAFAEHLGIPLQRVNEVIRGKRGVTPETAWLFSQALGTTPQFWMNLQNAYDLTSRRPQRSVERFVKAA
jgi:addiction module HigA family antidote